MEESDFFLEIDFYINKILHQHWRTGWVSQLSYSNEEKCWPIMVYIM